MCVHGLNGDILQYNLRFNVRSLTFEYVTSCWVCVCSKLFVIVYINFVLLAGKYLTFFN